MDTNKLAKHFDNLFIVSMDVAKAKQENLEAELDCAEHFGLEIDSAEFSAMTQKPF